MKKYVPVLLLAPLLLLLAFSQPLQPDVFIGAWQHTQGDVQQVLIVEDGYYTCTQFDKANKKFIGAYGGAYTVAQNKITTTIEFNATDKEEVGTTHTHDAVVSGNRLQLTLQHTGGNWNRIDDGKGTLAGNWRITGRMQHDKMETIQRGDRKTLKILSGTRFQWMAINPATKEFFGTGGGTYTFKDGKYTETIEFFSRDSSRVGAVLVFDGVVTNNVWTHKGLTSKGTPLHEEWTREK